MLQHSAASYGNLDPGACFGEADIDMNAIQIKVLALEYAAAAAYVQDYNGIVTMFGSADAAGKPVLMISGVRDSSVKLLELPAFNERGVLPEVSSGEARVHAVVTQPRSLNKQACLRAWLYRCTCCTLASWQHML